MHNVTHEAFIPKSELESEKMGDDKINNGARCWWLTPVILATQEVEIRRITVRSQPGQIVHQILSQKTLYKNRAGGVARGESPEFKPQYHKINKQIKEQWNTK
jgi:hypothetical protein